MRRVFPLRWSAGLVLAALLLQPGLVFAYGNHPDKWLMDFHGYSPETVRLAKMRIDFQEGREPPAVPKRSTMAWRNFLNNDWTGALEPFGQDYFDQPKSYTPPWSEKSTPSNPSK